MRNICEQVFGKRKSDLNPDELREFQRVSKAASYYRHHTRKMAEQREAARTKKQRIIEALGIEPACNRCRYNRTIFALDFHHPDPSVKESSVLNQGFQKALDEARKCELVCSNCHREIHSGDEPEVVKTGRPREADPLLDKYLAACGLSREL